MIWAKMDSEKRLFPQRRWLWMLLAIIAFAVSLYLRTQIVSIYPWVYILYFPIAIIICSLTFSNNKIFTFFGGISLECYLLFEKIIYVFTAIGIRINIRNPVVVNIIAVIVTIPAAYILSKLMQRMVYKLR